MADYTDILIIGGGGIGSRHLQALARMERPFSITVVDPSEESRELAKTRFGEVPCGAAHRLTVVSDLADAPATADVCIVGTPAGPRRAIIEQLAARHRIRFLILEKILFQARADYPQVARILADAGISAWVNCPRRLWPRYQEMRERIAGAGPVALHVVSGRRTALGTNAIHFLDTLDFLSGGGRRWVLQGNGLSALEAGSRHQQVVEFKGHLHGASDQGDFFSYTLHDDAAFHVLDVSAPGYRWVIREANGVALTASEADGWEWTEVEFPLVFQSTITGTVVSDLLDGGDCNLPTLAESSALHLAVLDSYFEALALPETTETTVCPVT